MAKKHPRYAPEFRRQMIELVRAGRTPEELAKEFEPSAQTIRNWVAQADRDEGRREDGLTSAEREELNRLRRENRQLKLEREILSKAAAWFARETDVIPPKGSNREREPGPLPHRRDVPRLGRLPQRLLRMGEAADLGACPDGRRVDRKNPGGAYGVESHLWSTASPD